MRTAVLAREPALGASPAQQQPAAGAQHDRKQERRTAEQEEEHVGQPGADRSDAVVNHRRVAPKREPGSSGL